MQVAVISNPVSGSGRSAATAAAIEREIAARGWTCVRVATERAEPAQWLDPTLGSVDAAVVAGGDGALRMVAPSAARLSVPLWHAPCGTENLFARAFGMSRDPQVIVRAIEARIIHRVDLADANGVPFAIMASLGFDAAVVHALAARRRGGITRWSYAMPILEVVRDWRPPELAWQIDGERELLGRGMVVVGNLPHYARGLNPAARAVGDDGLLDAVFIPAGSALELLPWIPLLWTGVHLRHPALRERRGAEIVLESAPASPFQLDGDAVEGGAVGRLSLRSRPGALSLLRAP
jgi:diacylglycerol kinase (ATP)